MGHNQVNVYVIFFKSTISNRKKGRVDQQNTVYKLVCFVHNYTYNQRTEKNVCWNPKARGQDRMRYNLKDSKH